MRWLVPAGRWAFAQIARHRQAARTSVARMQRQNPSRQARPRQQQEPLGRLAEIACCRERMAVAPRALLRSMYTRFARACIPRATEASLKSHQALSGGLLSGDSFRYSLRPCPLHGPQSVCSPWPPIRTPRRRARRSVHRPSGSRSPAASARSGGCARGVARSHTRLASISPSRRSNARARAESSPASTALVCCCALPRASKRSNSSPSRAG